MWKWAWIILLPTIVLAQDMRVPSGTRIATISGLCNKTTYRVWRNLTTGDLVITCNRTAPPANVVELVPKK